MCGFIPVFAGKHAEFAEERFFTMFVAVKKDLLNDQCGKLFPNIEKAIDVFNTLYPDTPLVKGTPWKPTKLIIDMTLNGQQVPYAGFDGISANAEVNAGYTSHVLFCDESQEIDFESFNEQIKPFTTRTGGILFAIGTTLSNPDNVLFDMYADKNIPKDRKILYTWEMVYEYKKLVNEALADKYKRRVEQEIAKYGLNSDYVQSQYYVSFDIVGDKFMTIERLRGNNVMTGDYGFIEPPKNSYIVAGFDPAVANDYAAFTLGTAEINLDSNQKLDSTSIVTTLREVEILNRDRHRISIDYLIDEVCERCKKYKIDMLMFDATAGQEHAAFFLIKELKQRGIGTFVIPFSFSNKNKGNMFAYLEDCLFNQTLILPSEDYRETVSDYDELIEEICYLQKKKSPSGHLQYKAPEGEAFFDDAVCSLAMMNYCLYYTAVVALHKIQNLGDNVVLHIKPRKYSGVETKQKKRRAGHYGG
jgi:hypothetical protein